MASTIGRLASECGRAGLIAVLAAGCGTGVQGSGKIVERRLEASGFSEFSVCCGWQVEAEQGETAEVTLRGDDNIVGEIVARRRGAELSLEYAKPNANFRPTERPLVHIVAPTLLRADASGGVSMTLSDVSAPRFSIDASAGTDVTLKSMTVGTLEVEASAGSRLTLENGDIEKQRISLSAGSSFDGTEVASLDGEYELSSGSSATVWITRSLSCDASSGSALGYYGAPTIGHLARSSGGGIKNLGERP